MTDTATAPKGRKGFTRPTAENKGPVEQVTELKDLVVTYAKQETVDPLKTLGRHLGYGIGGAVLISLGWTMGLLALLRGLQQITFFSDPQQPDGGTWSWLPYILVTIVGLAAAGIYATLVKARLNDEGRPR